MDSDKNTSMMASQVFEKVLQEVQVSNLNFQLQVSPFSALISLRKSFVKEKDGTVRVPRPSEADLINENIKLKNESVAVRHEFTVAVEECAVAHARIKFFEDLQKKPIENEDEKKDENISRLILENKIMKEKIIEQDDTIKDLQKSIHIKMEVSKSLNKQLSETKTNAGKEKAAILKEHKAEVKLWRKCLGEERKQKIKLEKELELSKETIATNILIDEDPNQAVDTDTPHLSRYHPQTDSLSDPTIPSSICEELNSTCNHCKHSPQCVLRQPFPPPSPAMPFLQNEETRYHEHMMSKTGVPGKYGGCERCMREYSKNYGCDDCIWLKWHGELYGYPDINPWNFKNHLTAVGLQFWGLR